jgi:thiol-disulfide isomerase/thioredoxin
MIEAVVATQIVLGILVLFNLVLTLAMVRRVSTGSGDRQSMVGLKAGDDVPDFTAVTLDGREVTRAHFSERRTALIFVAPTCKPCVSALPEYLQLVEPARLHGTDLVLVSDGDLAGTREMVGVSPTTTVLAASREISELFNRFKVPGTPHFALIEKDKVLLSGMPNRSVRDWRALVEKWEQAASALLQTGVAART